MSGTSSVEKCPRCQRECLNTYSDHKPFDLVNAECTACGLYIYTSACVVQGKDLESIRDCYLSEGETIPPLTDKEKEQCAAWDKAHNIKVSKE